ncbi:putative tubulin-tyrosine ligase family protein [Blattamonas nauphoetae]|uniref:Tubulin-tyrosine ligase family protein n=1 Tax=Blattamonas nauphoetae TaxID=2049346 RepID=A0ABQ9YFV1_9EUKA|nr:putative tubulin-tyrosine ligase family protein [Blattamonas nauphoetae]
MFSVIVSLKQRTFIVKPDASCQGRGIYLTRNIDNISATDDCIVQTYIAHPHLINKLKYDIRLYVLVSSCFPLRMFMHREGLVRFATTPYEAPTNENIENEFMHLTNYAVNKKSADFVFDENGEQDGGKGSKWTIDSYRRYLREVEGIDDSALWDEISQVCVKTVLPIQEKLWKLYKTLTSPTTSGLDPYVRRRKSKLEQKFNTDFSSMTKEELIRSQSFFLYSSGTHTSMCFEVLGFDVMLDSQHRPHVIEVNHSPSFQCDTPLDFRVKYSLLSDVLRLVDLSPDERDCILRKERKETAQRLYQPQWMNHYARSHERMEEWEQQKIMENQIRYGTRLDKEKDGRKRKRDPKRTPDLSQRLVQTEQIYSRAKKERKSRKEKTVKEHVDQSHSLETPIASENDSESSDEEQSEETQPSTQNHAERFIRQLTEWEDGRLGGFKRIYPSALTVGYNKYSGLNDAELVKFWEEDKDANLTPQRSSNPVFVPIETTSSKLRREEAAKSRDMKERERRRKERLMDLKERQRALQERDEIRAKINLSPYGVVDVKEEKKRSKRVERNESKLSNRAKRAHKSDSGADNDNRDQETNILVFSEEEKIERDRSRNITPIQQSPATFEKLPSLLETITIPSPHMNKLTLPVIDPPQNMEKNSPGLTDEILIPNTDKTTEPPNEKTQMNEETPSDHQNTSINEEVELQPVKEPKKSRDIERLIRERERLDREKQEQDKREKNEKELEAYYTRQLEWQLRWERAKQREKEKEDERKRKKLEEEMREREILISVPVIAKTSGLLQRQPKKRGSASENPTRTSSPKDTEDRQNRNKSPPQRKKRGTSVERGLAAERRDRSDNRRTVTSHNPARPREEQKPRPIINRTTSNPSVLPNYMRSTLSALGVIPHSLPSNAPSPALNLIPLTSSNQPDDPKSKTQKQGGPGNTQSAGSLLGVSTDASPSPAISIEKDSELTQHYLPPLKT